MQSQTTLLTSGLQFAEQWLAQVALAQLKELGLHEALEAAKTSLALSATSTRGAVIVAEEQVAAKAAVATAGAGLAGVNAVGQAGLASGLAVSTAIAAQFAAIGTGLLATIVGTPFAPPFFAAASIVQAAGAASVAIGQGILSGALASASGALSGAMAFAKGGIVTGPTLGLMGEAGSPEAAIPLNDRGAAFMQKTMGLGNGRGGVVIIRNELNGRVLTEEVMKNMPGVYRLKMGNR